MDMGKRKKERKDPTLNSVEYAEPLISWVLLCPDLVHCWIHRQSSHAELAELDVLDQILH
jgi:hypothetical protein